MKNLAKLTKQDITASNEAIKDCLVQLLSKYGTPSFGSMSKRDVDLLLFNMMQKLGVINDNPTIYDVMHYLHITRTKARNLIYESTLRNVDDETILNKELISVIKEPKFMREGNKVCLEIDNPLLVDYMRQELKKLGHITDGSFSAEIVKMTPEAFSALFVAFMPKKDLNTIKAKFVALGLQPDTSPQAIAKQALLAIVNAALGKAGGALVDKALGAFKDWKDNTFDNIPNTRDELEGTVYDGVVVV